MATEDFMSEREKQDLRDAGRGHLLREFHEARLDKADDERKRRKEEPSHEQK